MIHLGVNIDHVATIRQARRGREPDALQAAHEAVLGGAQIITVHLREDRRHVTDADVQHLAATLAGGVRLNLEMAATDEMVGIA
ncbi:MAG TPA: pyridoxine 5'-phosphate synthase, partial [Phycisphaerales bacterium]|nr:pyridoxine 5'-phosphate synthase [Phycisphaerales bacterium]